MSVGWSPSSDASPSVVRYSKDKRPNTLPIQPFMFQHQVGKSQSQLLRPLLSEYVSQMQNRVRGKLTIQGGEEPVEDPPRRQVMAPGSVRPSPLGSYSPVRQRGNPSLEPCSACSPSPQCGQGSSRAPHSLSIPDTTDPLPLLATPWCSLQSSQAQGHSLVQGRPPATAAPPPLKNALSSPLLPVASLSCIQQTSPATKPNPLEPTHSYGSSQGMKASVADCSGPTLSKSRCFQLCLLLKKLLLSNNRVQSQFLATECQYSLQMPTWQRLCPSNSHQSAIAPIRHFLLSFLLSYELCQQMARLKF